MFMDLVNLDWSGYGYGRGVIAACDQKTIGFLQEEAEKFTTTNSKGEKFEFKIWTKSMVGPRHIFLDFSMEKFMVIKKDQYTTMDPTNKWHASMEAIANPLSTSS